MLHKHIINIKRNNFFRLLERLQFLINNIVSHYFRQDKRLACFFKYLRFDNRRCETHQIGLLKKNCKK